MSGHHVRGSWGAGRCVAEVGGPLLRQPGVARQLLARSNNIEHGSLTDRVLQEFGNPSRGFGQRPPVLFRMDSQDEPSARFIVGVDQTVATFAAVFADDAPASRPVPLRIVLRPSGPWRLAMRRMCESARRRTPTSASPLWFWPLRPWHRTRPRVPTVPVQCFRVETYVTSNVHLRTNI